MSYLVIPDQYLHQALLLLRQRPDGPIWCALGECRSANDHFWLTGPLRSSLDAGSGRANGKPFAHLLRIQCMTVPPGRARIPPSSDDAHLPPVLELVLGLGEHRGRLWLRHGPSTAPVESVMLVGPGMHQIPVSAAESSSPTPDEAVLAPVRLSEVSHAGSRRSERFSVSEDRNNNPLVLHHNQLGGFAGRLGLSAMKRLATPRFSHSPHVRWSRTIGGVGGESVWRRLVQLRVAVVGCGRSGSLLADMLAGVGIKRLVLIDPDFLEEHNLGEMAGVLPAQVGVPKVEALTEHLQRHGLPELEVECLAEPLWSPSAMQAAKRCDVLFVAVDHDGPRLAAATISTLYHKVLLDCAAGIQFSTPAQAPSSPAAATLPRVMGADVRLIVPGDGCLLCRGSLTHYADAVESLCRQPLWPTGFPNWQQQRAGSLRSLNTTAAGLALRLLEDLVAERVTGSVWAHLEFDSSGGHLAVTYPALTPPASGCVLCAKAGVGDAGLNWG